MIQKGSLLKISDNCGAKEARCIRIFKSKKKTASRGELILVSVRELRSSKRSSVRVKKGEIYNALITRTKVFKKNNFIDVGLTSFTENSVLLLNKQFKLIGSRILGPISKQFKTSKFSRFVLLSSGLV
jgi:large subunit ribosomal protein L14